MHTAPVTPPDETALPVVDPAESTDSLEQQLHSLYAERRELFEALGVCTAPEIIALVRSMEEQLLDLYSAKLERPLRG